MFEKKKKLTHDGKLITVIYDTSESHSSLLHYAHDDIWNTVERARQDVPLPLWFP